MGGNVYSCELLLNKALCNDKKTLTVEIFREIVDYIQTEYKLDYYQNYIPQAKNNNKVRIIRNLHLKAETDTEIIGDIINAGISINIVMLVLTHFGYNHTTDCSTSEDPSAKHYIMYDLNSIIIKKIENIF